MWILPRQLHTSPFVPDTEALISDLNEQSQVCAQSLLARSRVSPARTWSLKWKRDSWTQLLSGRILKPSHGPSFTAAWTSSLAAIRASHSAPPASDSAPKIHDTSGRLSQPELIECDQVSVSLRMSRDISALGFPTCCKTWQEWVTERRGAWRQRVNVARLTREKGSLFWPSVVASEVRQGFQDRSRGMKGSQESLTTAVVKDAANWPTASMSMTAGYSERDNCNSSKKAGHVGNELLRQVIKHGQADPASSSSLGSRQGLWLTPRANEPTGDSTFVTRNGDRGQHCSPSLTIQVEKTAQWATPRSGKTTDENPETWALRQAKGDVATMPLGAQVKCWGTPAANDANKQNVMCEVNSKQAGLPKSVGLELQRQWATPRNCGGPDYAKTTRPSSQSNSLSLPTQVAGKLNPRWVETLMGLPIGWTMPSCTSPQTIAPMSCDSSAMELSQPPPNELSEFSLAS